MSNYDRAFGFQIYGELLRARYYAVVTNTTINVMMGDMVGTHANHLLTPMGYLPQIYETAVIDGVDNVLGAVLGIYDEDGFPVPYIAATEAGNTVIAGFVLVADHPEQQYVAREDYNTAAIDIAGDASENTDIVSRTISAGNTATGRSHQMLASNLIAETAALQMKLYGPHPADTDLVGDNTPGTSGEEGCRWICKVNEHFHNMTGVDGGASA